MHAANFSVMGFSLPFLPVWLDGNGLGKAQIGFILAMPILVRVFAAPWVAGLADRHMQPGHLLAWLNGVAMLGYFLLAAVDGFWPILIIMLAMSVGLSGIVPVADALTNAHVRLGGGVDYGRVRVWGSVSFLGANLLGGVLIKLAGVMIVPPAMALCAMSAIMAALRAPMLPPTESLAQAVPAANQPLADAVGAGELSEARRRRAFRYMLAASAMVQASHGALYAFGTLYWKSAGIGDVTIGVLWAIGVAAEILLFAKAARLRSLWLGTRQAHAGLLGLHWIMIGAAFSVLRFAAMAFRSDVGSSLALQMLHAASFGLTHLGAMAAIALLAPAGAGSKAQGQLTAVHAVAIALAMVISGFLYEKIGGLAFLSMVPVALLGFGLAAFACRVLASREPGGA